MQHHIARRCRWEPAQRIRSRSPGVDRRRPGVRCRPVRTGRCRSEERSRTRCCSPSPVRRCPGRPHGSDRSPGTTSTPAQPRGWSSRSGTAAPHLRWPDRRRRRRVDRVPPRGDPAVVVRRRPRARAARRPGRRPARQLVQPRAVRAADHPAVGAADRVDEPRLPAGPATRDASPAAVPLRAALELPRSGPDRAAERAGSAPVGPGVRALPDLVRRRPGVPRDDPDRPDVRPPARHRRERLGLIRRRRAGSAADPRAVRPTREPEPSPWFRPPQTSESGTLPEPSAPVGKPAQMPADPGPR